jgi:hypothetical protein
MFSLVRRLPCRERASVLTEQCATWIGKKRAVPDISFARSDCIERMAVNAVPYEPSDFSRSCIRKFDFSDAGCHALFTLQTDFVRFCHRSNAHRKHFALW